MSDVRVRFWDFVNLCGRRFMHCVLCWLLCWPFCSYMHTWQHVKRAATFLSKARAEGSKRSALDSLQGTDVV